MKKWMVLSWAIAAVFALACVTPAEEDAATGGDGGAADARVRTDARANDAGPGTWNPDKYGISCTTAGQCPGGACIEIYTGTYSGGKRCFKTCTAVGDCSDFPYDVAAVNCLAIQQGGPQYCLHMSAQNGPCGNAMNAVCNSQTYPDYAVCSPVYEDGTGYCMRYCDPNNPTTCRVVETTDQYYAQTCGCKGGQGCSTSMIYLSVTPDGGTPSVDGICAPTTAVGAACGLASTGGITLCTGNQECAGLSETVPTGTCAVIVDGGAGNG